MTAAPFQTFLARALADGHAEITGEGRNQRIHYLAADHSERWADPEEKVRAELWAELIYKYEYDPALIGFEVNVPRRTPNDYADLVIYSDGAMKMPYFVIECKRADIRKRHQTLWEGGRRSPIAAFGELPEIRQT